MAEVPVSSTLPVPVTSPGVLSDAEPFDRVSEPSHKVSSEVTPVISPIGELWNQAYDDLRAEEETLVRNYEATLSGNLNAIIGSTVVLSGWKIEREEQMNIVLKSMVEEVNKNTWKLKFGGKEILDKNPLESVIVVIGWANEYISDAVGSNPDASIAWAGVVLLLPVSSIVQNPFAHR
jgi:ankyrin repeat domain-containing protein 50